MPGFKGTIRLKCVNWFLIFTLRLLAFKLESTLNFRRNFTQCLVGSNRVESISKMNIMTIQSHIYTNSGDEYADQARSSDEKAKSKKSHINVYLLCKVENRLNFIPFSNTNFPPSQRKLKTNRILHVLVSVTYQSTKTGQCTFPADFI
jgi:hypothetical protein